MRLAGKIKAGFYPAPLSAIDLACQHIAAGPNSTILDPCAGEGEAVGYLAGQLGIAPEDTFACELDGFRGEVAKANPAIGNLLTPATIFGLSIPFRSMSMLWLNPPFDDDSKGGRCEGDFLRVATNWLEANGILAFVCPANIVQHYSVEIFLAQNYENITILPFPEADRRFNEVVVLATRRKRRAEVYNLSGLKAPEGFKYQLPEVGPVKWFHRSELPEHILEQRIQSSKLQRLLRNSEEIQPPSPPLALGVGHIALLLASGQLDGVVHPDGEEPHVVRGTARKVQVKMGVQEDEKKTVTTYMEQIQLVVRAVWPNGEIQEFTEGPEAVEVANGAD